MHKIIEDIEQLINENIWTCDTSKLFYSCTQIQLKHKTIYEYQIHAKDLQKLYEIAYKINSTKYIELIRIINKILHFNYHQYIN